MASARAASTLLISPPVRDPLTAEVLPSSVCREVRGVVLDRNNQPWIPIYCANCGKSGGMVPEPSKDFAFYLCDSPCGEMWSPLMDYMVVPQEKFWEIARQEQMERLGRHMTELEIVQALADPNHWIQSLVRSEAEHIKRRK